MLRRPPLPRMGVTGLALLGGLLWYAVAAAGQCTDEPAAVYRAHCGRCHGDDGRSDTSYARALKVEPLLADRRLAGMGLAEVVTAVKTNDKHGLLVHLDDRALQCAAIFVLDLAKQRGTAPSQAPSRR